jgi:hypothetical protein
VDVSYRASHHNLFATLLDLMGTPDDVRPAGYGRSLLRARASDEDRRVVFGGNLMDAVPSRAGDFDSFPRPDIRPPHQ